MEKYIFSINEGERAIIHLKEDYPFKDPIELFRAILMTTILESKYLSHLSIDLDFQEIKKLLGKQNWNTPHRILIATPNYIEIVIDALHLGLQVYLFPLSEKIKSAYELIKHITYTKYLPLTTKPKTSNILSEEEINLIKSLPLEFPLPTLISLKSLSSLPSNYFDASLIIAVEYENYNQITSLASTIYKKIKANSPITLVGDILIPGFSTLKEFKIKDLNIKVKVRVKNQ